MSHRKGYRRGYPVAVLVGLEEKQAVLWAVFSNVVKPQKTINLSGARNDTKALYNFHEIVVNAIRPAMNEGVKSIILSSPLKTSYSENFLAHIKNHHTWLITGANKAVFSQIKGPAVDISQVTVLTRKPEFKKIIEQTTIQETENLIDILEKRLNQSGPEPMVLYSFEAIEDQIISTWKQGKTRPEYLLLTDSYLSTIRQKVKLQRLMQIATNRQIKTRIVKSDSPAGKRLTQLGGFVSLQKIE
ncbi:MAG: hypothetical protein GX638_12450 [Crenarchaeota archaeon]|nr:hypothetical protein [Thermoproteota archaeon]